VIPEMSSEWPFRLKRDDGVNHAKVASVSLVRFIILATFPVIGKTVSIPLPSQDRNTCVSVHNGRQSTFQSGPISTLTILLSLELFECRPLPVMHKFP
jgi:hypothetical protein